MRHRRHEADATAYIRQNQSIRSTIDALSRKTQSGSTQAHEMAKKVIHEETDKEKLLRRELEDALARLKAMEGASETALKESDSELDDLIAEGNRLNIKGIHLIAKGKSLEDRKAAIRAKIDTLKNESFS